ncbi:MULTISPECIES: TauD/TfdA family dioxygenase [unclassified Pseudonocardia]|uniref:TauD/TfdA dioxygenase family protein n=1 Tax=unclassified Pseudonocardia TaxID=2619320 RepID=UPI000492813E|nr:TauD/TfdA family dioxygenase [Pseudonocardia sp. Ae707_Ps1]OLM09150.1 Alpha-ketoglutarate-dependent taurine dioxygenase [Pseudonocardia sp. Ae707_Ps1]
MDHTVLRPVGVTVTGMGLHRVGPVQIGQLVGLLAEYGVVILPDQADADDSAFLSFLRGFGDLTFTPGETPVPGYPDLNVVSNVGRTTPPRSSFHVDTSYIARPPAYTALRAVSVPAHGGATQFSNQYRAYDTLPDGLRQRLAGRAIRHVVTGLTPGDAGGETEAEHPVFRRHPVSGRVALYLSTPARCVSVSGMSAQESSDVIHELFEHSTRADNVMCHAWSPGDVVIWDNACVLHRADHAGVVGDRVMHRGMITGGPTMSA